MKKRIILYAVTLSMLFLAGALNYTDRTVPVIGQAVVSESPKTKAVKRKNNRVKKTELVKGLWVTYMELDMSKTDRSYTAFRNKFDAIVKDAVDFGFNTIVVQVRPFCDALYKSKYFPASHILSGEQGRDCGYDALKYMCRVCHKNKLNIEAWINPYRVCSSETPNKLSDDNPYVRNNSIGEKISNGIFLNPANNKVRKLILDGVREIIENYEVDGIQFDDYFYPTQDKDFDSAEYSEYRKNTNGKKLSLSQWRKNNVNQLIKSVYKAVHSENSEIVFGISPQGNIKNNAQIYADVKTWCTQKGYIDYICPQLYYSPDNPALAYEDAAAAWLRLKTNKAVKIYSGLAGYKAGTDKDEGTWEDFDDILSKEYSIAVEKKYDGIMLYSYSSLSEKSAEKEMKNLKQALK